MKEWAKSFYTSTAWRQCRDAYYAAQHGICETCQGAGKIVHHTIYLTPSNINDPDISLNWDHLRLDCQTCHNQEHHGSSQAAVREGLMFDESGDLVETHTPPIKIAVDLRK